MYSSLNLDICCHLCKISENSTLVQEEKERLEEKAGIGGMEDSRVEKVAQVVNVEESKVVGDSKEVEEEKED